jgi:hypothetical protein
MPKRRVASEPLYAEKDEENEQKSLFAPGCDHYGVSHSYGYDWHHFCSHFASIRDYKKQLGCQAGHSRIASERQGADGPYKSKSVEGGADNRCQ